MNIWIAVVFFESCQLWPTVQYSWIFSFTLRPRTNMQNPTWKLAFPMDIVNVWMGKPMWVSLSLLIVLSVFSHWISTFHFLIHEFRVFHAGFESTDRKLMWLSDNPFWDLGGGIMVPYTVTKRSFSSLDLVLALLLALKGIHLFPLGLISWFPTWKQLDNSFYEFWGGWVEERNKKERNGKSSIPSLQNS